MTEEKKELWRVYFEKEQKISKGVSYNGIEVEYRCNTCGRYFYSDKEGVTYPTCPYCGSSDVWEF